MTEKKIFFGFWSAFSEGSGGLSGLTLSSNYKSLENHC